MNFIAQHSWRFLPRFLHQTETRLVAPLVEHSYLKFSHRCLCTLGKINCRYLPLSSAGITLRARPNRTLFTDTCLDVDKLVQFNNKQKLMVVNPEVFKEKLWSDFVANGMRNVFITDLDLFLAMSENAVDMEKCRQLIEALLKEDLRIVISSEKLGNLLHRYFEQCQLLRLPEVALAAWNCPALQQSKLLTANPRIPLLLLNLLMLTDHHEEVAAIFQQHRSALIRQRNVVLLAAIALYKIGTEDALRKSVELMNDADFPYRCDREAERHRTGRAVLAVALLAYDHKEYGLAHSILSKYESSKRPSFLETSLKLLILIDSGRLEQAISYIRSSTLPRDTDQKTPKFNRKILYCAVTKLLQATSSDPQLHREMLEIVQILDKVVQVESLTPQDLLMAPIDKPKE